ncbi:FAD-dependent monooxygenase [bacterium endosymbiont of Pedicinus badii]|uniref:FAD-dependent monooxygenase n=1 Tax=bacterium endosymbiont of Pedicinus badii TaxID=1719126 RepID=UPI0009C8FC8B|nr:FAD-dependent monooxygenase [bacterium endosymbiont of Pedicinus badii]OQM34315.1 hypothetical protein AOQ89_00230 [bacterium endosymbiont of Pedicinus badii]
MKKNIDITIFGNGIIGYTLAISLLKIGYSVALVESTEEKNTSKEQILFINYKSEKFLRNLGILQKIDPKYYKTYKEIEIIFEKINISLSAKLLKISHLGFLIESNKIKKAAKRILKKQKNFFVFNFHSIRKIYKKNNFWKILVHKKLKIFSNIIVGADGKESYIRDFFNFDFVKIQYKQCCILITVRIYGNYKKKIWQFFDYCEIYACLPIRKNYFLLIFYTDRKKIKIFKKKSLLFFKKKISKKFFLENKKFFIKKISFHNLYFQNSLSFIKNGIFLIGDAAHTFHPFFGQGLNFSIQEIQNISKILKKKSNYSINQKKILNTYQKMQRKKTIFMQFFINSMYFLFNKKSGIFNFLKFFIFFVLKKKKKAKKFLLKFFSGIY